MTRDETRTGKNPDKIHGNPLHHSGGVDRSGMDRRRTRALLFLDTLWQDLRFTVRTMRRNPGVTLAAVLTLGLGIGATTAIFTVVYGVLLRPLPYPDPERLLYIKGDTWGPFSGSREHAAWKSRSQTLSHVAAYMDSAANLSGAGEAERVTCGIVTASFFPLLGLKPAIGRSFLPEEDRPGSAPVAILSDSLWRRRFGADPFILGKAMALDEKNYTIIGVLPAQFQIPDQYRFDYDVWMPLSQSDTLLVRVIGRLKPGVSLEQARAELDTILQSTLRKGVKRRAVVVPWQEEITGGAKLSLVVFLAAVGFVLLIACLNVANLLLARVAAREREIVIRRTLGAGNLRILRQLLTESVLMALLGGTAGLLLALWGKNLLIAFISSNLPVLAPVAIDHRVLVFNLGVALSTGLAFGLAPALQASRMRVNESLKEGGRSATEGRTGRRLRNLLVITEIGLALMLLIGAGLLLKSFLRLRGVDPGFRTDRILSLSLDLTPSRYPKPQDQARYFQQVVERIGGISGVQSVGASTSLELYGGSGGSLSGLEVEGRSEPIDSGWTTVSTEYFRTMGIPLVKGRFFTAEDRDGAPGVAIVNETFARRLFPNEDCLGKRIKFRSWMTIVGVVADVRGYSLAKEMAPVLYFPFLQNGRPHMRVLVRTAGDPLRWAAAVRSQIASIDKDQPPHNLITLEQLLAQHLRSRRATMLLLTTFALFALTLASIGVFGVISYSVTQRSREIGIRVALGARNSHILRSVLGQGIILAVTGILLGLAGALGLSKFIRSMLFEVEETDPMTYVGISLLLLLVAAAGCYIPARRAAKIDPIVVLSHE